VGLLSEGTIVRNPLHPTGVPKDGGFGLSLAVIALGAEMHAGPSSPKADPDGKQSLFFSRGAHVGVEAWR